MLVDAPDKRLLMPRQAPRARLVSGRADRAWGATPPRCDRDLNLRTLLNAWPCTSPPPELAGTPPCAHCKEPLSRGEGSRALLGNGRTGVTHRDCALRWHDPRQGGQVFAPTKAPKCVYEALNLKASPPGWQKLRPDQRWLLMVALHPKFGVDTARRLLGAGHADTEWVLQVLQRCLLLPMPTPRPPSTPDLLRVTRRLPDQYISVSSFSHRCGWAPQRAVVVLVLLVRVGAVEQTRVATSHEAPSLYVRSLSLS